VSDFPIFFETIQIPKGLNILQIWIFIKYKEKKIEKEQRKNLAFWVNQSDFFRAFPLVFFCRFRFCIPSRTLNRDALLILSFLQMDSALLLIPLLVPLFLLKGFLSYLVFPSASLSPYPWGSF